MKMKAVLLLALLCPISFGRIFTPCELAEELTKKKYKLPREQIATWVCIAHRESTYNTSAIGCANGDGSQDHGLFQISDKYWCSPPGNGEACGQPCSAYEDDDIRDDVICARRIYRAHQHLHGDGFLAWAVYGPYCKGDNAVAYLADCDLEKKAQERTESEDDELEEEVTNKTSIVPFTAKAKIRYFRLLFGKVGSKTPTGQTDLKTSLYNKYPNNIFFSQDIITPSSSLFSSTSSTLKTLSPSTPKNVTKNPFNFVFTQSSSSSSISTTSPTTSNDSPNKYPNNSFFTQKITSSSSSSISNTSPTTSNDSPNKYPNNSFFTQKITSSSSNSIFKTSPTVATSFSSKASKYQFNNNSFRQRITTPTTTSSSSRATNSVHKYPNNIFFSQRITTPTSSSFSRKSPTSATSSPSFSNSFNKYPNNNFYTHKTIPPSSSIYTASLTPTTLSLNAPNSINKYQNNNLFSQRITTPSVVSSSSSRYNSFNKLTNNHFFTQRITTPFLNSISTASLTPTTSSPGGSNNVISKRSKMKFY